MADVSKLDNPGVARPSVLPSVRVLVADDDDDLRRITAAMLRHLGHEVATAPNGSMALSLLDGQEFDLVLSDIVMPDLGGLELLRRVRQRDLDLPVLLMTARPEIDTAIDAVTYGALRYLRKPLTPEVLSEAVSEAVRLRRLALLRRRDPGRGGTSWAGTVTPRSDSAVASFRDVIASARLAYQPIVRARDLVVYGHEALLRVPEHHALSAPGAVELAMRLGLLAELSATLQRQVAATLARDPERLVFVNLHPQELMDDALYERAAPLTPHARRVVLEITEQAAIERVPDLRARLRDLRALGFRLALDDLGAGYAALSSFAALAPEFVKIDLSLVRGIDQEPVKRTLVASLVRLCHDLGMTPLAEGVETEAERDALTELGCVLLQGYLFGRPCFEGGA
jgi:EAL domain-containing protein (putative c-di-GMP-specific phosphodiesterase class I)